jgi:predicted Rossmann fold nucleotide-binding protein DprA/Smf involved in DNA uptake
MSEAVLRKSIGQLEAEQRQLQAALDRCERRMEGLQARADMVAEVLESLRKVKMAPLRIENDGAPTQLEQVFRVIEEAHGKVTIQQVQARTGLHNHVIASLVSRLYRQGRVERVGRGVYRLRQARIRLQA